MGTRGIFGFTDGKKDWLIYQSHESHPENLGEEVADFCREQSMSSWSQIAAKLQKIRLNADEDTDGWSPESLEMLLDSEDSGMPATNFRENAGWVNYAFVISVQDFSFAAYYFSSSPSMTETPYVDAHLMYRSSVFNISTDWTEETENTDAAIDLLVPEFECLFADTTSVTFEEQLQLRERFYQSVLNPLRKAIETGVIETLDDLRKIANTPGESQHPAIRRL